MGYCVTMDVSNLSIPKDKKEDALKAINALHDPELMQKQAGGGVWKAGGERTYHYSWVTNPEDGGFKDLVEAIKEWRYEAYEDEDGNVHIEYFTGEKLGNCNVLWKALAQYLTDGHIDCRGEDGALWRWEIKNGTFKELDGTVTYR